MATSRHVTANGIRLHIVEAGAGPLVVLLHGFPEFSYSWRRQLPVLAAAGFHAVAPTCVATARVIGRRACARIGCGTWLTTWPV